MGVWIETLLDRVYQKCTFTVTPCVGVWIETQELVEGKINSFVTPCVGVWIETYSLIPSDGKR